MSLISRIRGLRQRRPSPPAERVVYQPIGVVRNRVRDERAGGWQGLRSDIVVDAVLAPALDGIEGFSHAIVVFHLDRVPDEARRERVTLARGGAAKGVLATRSQLRPNPIGVTVVRIIERRDGVLRVQGLDALDGTPVLDLKPYVPPYDAVPDAQLPDWAIER